MFALNILGCPCRAGFFAGLKFFVMIISSKTLFIMNEFIIWCHIFHVWMIICCHVSFFVILLVKVAFLLYWRVPELSSIFCHCFGAWAPSFALRCIHFARLVRCCFRLLLFCIVMLA
jgi:hypothetical protein